MTTKTDLRRTLTKKGFSAWLDGFGNKKIVGKAVENQACPIWSYMSSSLNNDEISVTSSMVFGENLWTDETGILLPKWARCFIRGTDRADVGADVTTKRAREILAQC